MIRLTAGRVSPILLKTVVARARMPKRKTGGGAASAAVNKGKNEAKAKKQKKLDKFFSPTVGAAARQTDNAGLDLGDLIIDDGWKQQLNAELLKPYFKKINDHLRAEFKKNKEIFPPKHLIFNAFNLTPFNDIKVVIIGQDPYHDIGQAHGLCFSVPNGVTPPPSLKNIYKELSADISGFRHPSHGCLEQWATRGVLLLNATLTVEAHQPNSHSNIGWQTFTDAAIKLVSQHLTGVVFILWGGFAQKKSALIDAKKHSIIKAAHPSPLSARKFFGCKCFSQANDFLKQIGKAIIDWKLD